MQSLVDRLDVERLRVELALGPLQQLLVPLVLLLSLLSRLGGDDEVVGATATATRSPEASAVPSPTPSTDPSASPDPSGSPGPSASASPS